MNGGATTAYRKANVHRDGIASHDNETQHDRGRRLSNDGVKDKATVDCCAPLVELGVVDRVGQTKGVTF